MGSHGMVAGCCALVCLLHSGWALAQGDDEPAGEEAATEGGAEAGEASAAEALDEKKPEANGDVEDPNAIAAENEDSPVEVKGKPYYFVGLRYRGIIVPKFMVNLFGDGGRTVYVDGIGPEFSIRKDNFENIFSIWYADYGMEDTPFKSSSDPDEGFEIVNSELAMLYLTADFQWSHDFSPVVAFNYGLGAGFGIVFGDLHRNQSKPPNNTNTPGDPYSYVPCAPGERGVNLPYCDTDNDHYGDYTEPSWANGGSKPNIFPWLALQLGMRFKPHRHFAGRLDFGFGTSGFFFGLGADYGL